MVRAPIINILVVGLHYTRHFVHFCLYWCVASRGSCYYSCSFGTWSSYKQVFPYLSFFCDFCPAIMNVYFEPILWWTFVLCLLVGTSKVRYYFCGLQSYNLVKIKKPNVFVQTLVIGDQKQSETAFLINNYFGGIVSNWLNFFCKVIRCRR